MHLSYAGLWGAVQFEQRSDEGPWLLYDKEGQSAIISPASHFLTASITSGPSGEIRSGVNTRISRLSAGFRQETMLALGSGINKTYELWGQAMIDQQGKQRVANDADQSLRTLGYWTDNGAAYYYKHDAKLNYADTLVAIKEEFAQKGLPIGYLQLDSWFYPKGIQNTWSNSSGGIFRYEADPELFPGGLAAFQRRLGVPVITHARWIDKESPVRQQYRMSGNVPTDLNYWNDVARYLQQNGVATFEQDWLAGGAQTEYNLTDPEEYLNNMAQAMAANHLSMQYCMSSPSHYLQTTKYPNLTTIRTSDDRFGPTRWDNFVYASRMASALGTWPWADVFFSRETPNLVLSLLSGGVVGVGDSLGDVDRANLQRAIRADGVLVKPDTSIAPLDEVFIRDAAGMTHPMIAASFTEFENTKAAYVFAYERVSTDRNVAFRPASLGFQGEVFVYDFFAGTGTAMNASDEFKQTMAGATAYYVVVPVGPSRIGFLGDAGQLVPLGRKRISQVVERRGLEATIEFVAGETSRVVQGYSRTAPIATAVKGNVRSITFDAVRHLFQATVEPAADGQATIYVRPSPSMRRHGASGSE